MTDVAEIRHKGCARNSIKLSIKGRGFYFFAGVKEITFRPLS
jgi:hypothetical protein